MQTYTRDAKIGVMTKELQPARPLTLVEVAQRLGVSKSTVSAAFTGRGTITTARREAVKSAAVELGYEPNPHAQRLVRGLPSDMICLCTPTLGVGARTRIVERLQERIVERGIAAPIHVAGNHAAEGEYQQSVFRALRLQRPRAMVCFLSNLLPELREELRRYVAAGGILVGADASAGDEIDCDRVRFDGQHNAFMATKHLIDNGHTAIGLFQPSPAKLSIVTSDNPILEGYRRAHQECGLIPRGEWYFRHSYYEQGGIWLADTFLQLAERPTAMFIVNDNAASAFVQQLYRAGLRVPCDVSVVGHDDAPPATACMTPLTTVSWPIDEIVREIDAMLSSRIDGSYSGPPREVVVRGELRIRESVRAL